MKNYHRVVLLTTLLALTVIVAGAWVRLTDAGLGCPDWPGCYGTLTVPTSENEVESANLAFPERPVEVVKARNEMIHRYMASTLGLLIVGLAVHAFRNRRQPDMPFRLTLLLVVLVIFQGLLGMWTVTLLLKPLIVMGHLLGGMTTLALLVWLALKTRYAKRWRKPDKTESQNTRRMTVAATIALCVVLIQIALGGWTSTNYAALACPDFPTCQNQWIPENADYAEGFVMWRGLGVDYEGGVLDHPARVAIHYVHRIGALVVTAILIWVALVLMRRGAMMTRRSALFIKVLLLVQLVLGIATVKYALPLTLAVAHNGNAALLLAATVAANYFVRNEPARH